MILEIIGAIGQMAQGHPKAQAEYVEQVTDLRRSINNLTEIKQNLLAKSLSDPHTNALLAQQQAKLAELTGEDF